MKLRVQAQLTDGQLSAQRERHVREEKPAAKVATLRKLKALVRLSPASVDELAVSGLLGEDVPVRFWRTVIDVVQGKLGDPTLAELIQTLNPK